MTRDNSKAMAAFGRAVCTALILAAIGTLQIACSVPIARDFTAQDWPAVLLEFAAINLTTAFAYFIVYGVWFKTPRWH